jgi:hypothetical protein
VAVAAVLVRRAGLPGADVGLNKKGNIVFLKKCFVSSFRVLVRVGIGIGSGLAESREQRTERLGMKTTHSVILSTL